MNERKERKLRSKKRKNRKMVKERMSLILLLSITPVPSKLKQ